MVVALFYNVRAARSPRRVLRRRGERRVEALVVEAVLEERVRGAEVDAGDRVGARRISPSASAQPVSESSGVSTWSSPTIPPLVVVVEVRGRPVVVVGRRGACASTPAAAPSDRLPPAVAAAGSAPASSSSSGWSCSR